MLLETNSGVNNFVGHFSFSQSQSGYYECRCNRVFPDVFVDENNARHTLHYVVDTFPEIISENSIKHVFLAEVLVLGNIAEANQIFLGAKFDAKMIRSLSQEEKIIRIMNVFSVKGRYQLPARWEELLPVEVPQFLLPVTSELDAR